MSDRRIAVAVLLIGLLLAIGLGAWMVWDSFQPLQVTLAVSSPVVKIPTATPVPGGGCHSINGLPDPVCTPGVADPRVTQDNIQTKLLDLVSREKVALTVFRHDGEQWRKLRPAPQAYE